LAPEGLEVSRVVLEQLAKRMEAARRMLRGWTRVVALFIGVGFWGFVVVFVLID
jgi:hypothetical protein